jgi:hypothetical protein
MSGKRTAAIGIGYTTLEKRYKEVLATAATRANGRVATTLFAMATSGKDTAATIFWTKVRLGWRETSRVESVNATPVGNLEIRQLLEILNTELKDAPELRYRIAQRLHAAETAEVKVQ